MKCGVPLLAVFLLAASGCGLDKPKPSPAEEEPRHPSNEMNPLPKEEPVHRERPKPVAVKRTPSKPRRASAYEDPRKIRAGIPYSEMVRRFGPPTMMVSEAALAPTSPPETGASR